MMKNATTIKKFQFFDIESDNKSNDANESKFNFGNISPYSMFAVNGVIFLSAKVKKKIDHSFQNENLILKIVKNKIVDEYFIYNKMIHYFQLKSFNSKYYFVTCGGDFKDQIVGSDKFKVFVTSIKIYDATKLLDRNHRSENRNIENMLLKNINLLRNIETRALYQGKDFPKTIESIQNIISFAISDDFSHCAVGLDRGQIILIQASPNLIDCQEKNIHMRYITNIDSELHITNLAFTKINVYKENMNLLYASTTKAIYFYKIYDKTEEVYELLGDAGAYSGCIAIDQEKLVVAASTENYIIEYLNLERGPSWFFDGKKQYIGYFKNYLTFVIYEDKVTILAVFDRINKFFAYYNNSFSKISCLCHDEDNIYAFIENDDGVKNIIKLKEKDNKDKFDTFYKKSFFDTAYDYAKSLNYDKKKISEISRRHAYHLYQKGDYAKAIDQYILTINNLDPSYVIQLFLDGSKLEYLILYLEALHNDEQFKSRDPDEMKDYTALLLNCYIKMKKIEKLKDFVDAKNISDQLVDIETAIEVCKDTNQIELALSIAEKSKMIDYYIEIKIDFQKNYEDALVYLDKIKEINKKFQLFLKYGQKLLLECPSKMQKILKSFISGIISLKKSGNDPMIKYENLIKIFINQESLLEELLEYILTVDENCDASIIHRRIELHLDRLAEESKKDLDTKYTIIENINSIIKNKKYQNKIDKNYVLMLFKMHNFTVGIVTLSELMELRQELLSIYMDNHNYDKIINICENFGRMENNFWIQALNYFINIINGGEQIEEYIKLILNKVVENELLSPILVLEILKKKPNMKFETVKNFIVNSLTKEKKNLDSDKKEFEANYSKLEKINSEIKELKQKSKTFNITKCSLCSHTLQPPVVYFLCNHAYHLLCLNNDIKDDMKEIQCSSCVQKNTQITVRIKQAEDQANNHNNFFMELKTKPRKFDFIAKYLGKGIFKMDN